MAIDFLIFCLLIVSFIINLLALGAFWVTPGLRTTANRFTINLLIINLVGCLILAPTLFLSGAINYDDATSTGGASSASASSAAASLLQATANDDTIEYSSKAGNHQMTIRHNGKLVEQEGIILRRNVTQNSNRSPPAAPVNAQHHADSNERRTIETIYKRNTTYYQEFTIDESSDTIVITELEEDRSDNDNNDNVDNDDDDVSNQFDDNDDDFANNERVSVDNVDFPINLHLPNVTIRCWSIDMAAALGALAVLLIVGDTWCAVTDPLRYHSRISGVKSWVFIALTWALGILFGALSALRVLDFETETIVSKEKRFTQDEYKTTTTSYLFSSSASIVFGMIFACLYFVIIILLPFGFVCGMYWRIFSEARENGLRMRQNGSSPLLQSALNLTHQQQQQQQQQHQQQHQHQQQQQQINTPFQYSNSLCVHRNSVSSTSSLGGGSCTVTGSGNGILNGGLQMQIDHQRKSSPACLRRDSTAKVLLPTISDDGISDEINEEEQNTNLLIPLAAAVTTIDVPSNSLSDRNQNILLTLQSASGEIKRNYSARQLPLLGTSSQDLRETNQMQGIRQVQSSPNLQKYTQMRQDSLSDDSCSPHLLGHREMQNSMHHASQHHQRNHVHHSQQHQHQHHHHHNHHHHSHALQIPSIHASPKTLSYMSSLRHRLSNASSLFKYREESRAARISILVVIMFLVSYLPYGVLVLLQSRIAAANFQHSTQLAIFMIVLANLSSPFIFAYRNKRVRRGVKRLLGLQGRHERSLKRQSSSSCRGSGFLNRHSAKTTGISVKNIGSKGSTYSPSNSCKYLTPQNSILSNGCPTTTVTITPANNEHNGHLNECCNNHMGLGLTKQKNVSIDSCNSNGERIIDETQMHNNLIAATAKELQKSQQYGDVRIPIAPRRPVLQRGITIVEQIPLGSKLAAKRTLFRMFFQSTRSLNCSQGTVERNDLAPTEV